MDCSQCDKVFTRKDNLDRHLRTVHLPDKEEIYSDSESDSDSTITQEEEEMHEFEQDELVFYRNYLNAACGKFIEVKKGSLIDMLQSYTIESFEDEDEGEDEEIEEEEVDDDEETEDEDDDPPHKRRKIEEHSEYGDDEEGEDFLLNEDQLILLKSMINMIMLSELDLKKEEFIKIVTRMEDSADE